MNKIVRNVIAIVAMVIGSMGLAALVTGEGNAVLPSSAPKTNGDTASIHCESVLASTDAVTQELENIPKGSVAYAPKWLTLVNLVTGSPNCFDPGMVAEARAALQGYLGH